MSRSGATPPAATRPGGHHSIVQGDGYSATAMTETAKNSNQNEWRKPAEQEAAPKPAEGFSLDSCAAS
jgi:hypothetical protein